MGTIKKNSIVVSERLSLSSTSITKEGGKTELLSPPSSEARKTFNPWRKTMKKIHLSNAGSPVTYGDLCRQVSSIINEGGWIENLVEGPTIYNPSFTNAKSKIPYDALYAICYLNESAEGYEIKMELKGEYGGGIAIPFLYMRTEDSKVAFDILNMITISLTSIDDDDE